MTLHNQHWHVGQGNGTGCVFANEGRMRLETGGTTLYPICSVIDFDGERDDHARLIAHAPDLLRIARALHDWQMMAMGGSSPMYSPEWVALRALLDRIEGTSRSIIDVGSRNWKEVS